MITDWQNLRLFVPGGCVDVGVGVPGFTVVGYPWSSWHIEKYN